MWEVLSTLTWHRWHQWHPWHQWYTYTCIDAHPCTKNDVRTCWLRCKVLPKICCLLLGTFYTKCVINYFGTDTFKPYVKFQNIFVSYVDFRMKTITRSDFIMITIVYTVELQLQTNFTLNINLYFFSIVFACLHWTLNEYIVLLVSTCLIERNEH